MERIIRFPYSIVLSPRLISVDMIHVVLTDREAARLKASAKAVHGRLLSDDPSVDDIRQKAVSAVIAKERAVTDFLYDDPEERQEHYDAMRRIRIRVHWPPDLRQPHK